MCRDENRSASEEESAGKIPGRRFSGGQGGSSIRLRYGELVNYLRRAHGIVLALCSAGLLARPTTAQEKLTLKATLKTVASGYYDPKASPVFRGNAGDTLESQPLI